jgi:hypothetical protein
MATSATGRLSSDGQALERLTVAPHFNTPRLLTENDCGWMLDLGKRRYSNQFDFQATEQWYRNIVLKGPMMFWPMRTDNAFCIAMLSTTPWRPATPECNVTLVCAAENCMWEAVMLLRASIEWAKRRKCSLWRLSSETDFDLAPIAHKLGATEANVRYVLRLE